jgi:malate dehydrogenase (oxaloacetate-decarboxylating)
MARTADAIVILRSIAAIYHAFRAVTLNGKAGHAARSQKETSMAASAIGTTLIMRVETPSTPGAFGVLALAIGDAGGVIGAVDTRSVTRTSVVRDVSVTVASEAVGDAVRSAIEALSDFRIIHVSDATFLAHLGGKIRIEGKMPVKTRADLSTVYTPGVARVSLAIAADPAKAYQLTIKRNSVAVVTDGTAVLGLGDIGPYGAAPVMEGKCMLFRQFADIDAFPICLDTKDVDEIVATVKHIAPIFGGINLEDISAPRCFEVERRLIEELDIPVMHDDQHGTAVVILAAMINAAAVVGKRLEDMRIVLNGSGAAGTATIKMLLAAHVRDVIAVDRSGALNRDETYTNPHWQWLALNTNIDNRRGPLGDVLAGADAFIGVSAPNILNVEDIKKMARDPIVFAMANPTPEIMPDIAAPYVAVMGTGRSDFPNQVNNLLAFPGLFRGALDARASKISEKMKLAAAHAIADVVGDERSAEYVIPSVFDTRVVDAVAAAVRATAIEEGLARRALLLQDEESTLAGAKK